jgi:hypothetical protein
MDGGLKGRAKAAEQGVYFARVSDMFSQMVAERRASRWAREGTDEGKRNGHGVYPSSEDPSFKCGSGAVSELDRLSLYYF